VIQHWIDIWTANTTESEFKTVLEALCHKMKAERVDQCLHLVDDYYLPWFNYILHDLNAKTACSMMGLCGNNGNDFLVPDPQASISLLLTPAEQPEIQHPRIEIAGNDEFYNDVQPSNRKSDWDPWWVL
jgi:hypothetical protein